MDGQRKWDTFWLFVAFVESRWAVRFHCLAFRNRRAVDYLLEED